MNRRLVWSVCALALAVRLAGISWGLPETFEEAYPLKLALRMTTAPTSLNPGFFHYPSLVIYLECLVVWAVRAAAAIVGQDFRTLDPAYLYVPARSLIALFGALTTIPVYHFGSRAGGASVGLLAALLVALNPSLVRAAQYVSVDVPLVCLLAFALWAAIRLLDAGSERQLGKAATAGLLVGLAASAKYPGVAGAVPITLVLILRMRARPHLDEALAALIPMVAGFVLTSPFVLLDIATALRDLRAEQVHMHLGHFGSEGGASWSYYIHTWFAQSLGWIIGACALGGILLSIRERWAWILLALLVPLAIVLATTAVKTDRYLLPAIPAGAVFAAAFVGLMVRKLSKPLSLRGAIACSAALMTTNAPQVAAHIRALGPDSRTVARSWVTSHFSPGAMVVSEAYGPNVPSPLTILGDAPLKELVPLASVRRDAIYFSLFVPMFQVQPERAAVFYDPRLYPMADAWIVTGAVRDRYISDPARFPVQAAFYAWLAQHWSEVARIRLATGSGSEIVIYRNPNFDVPFMRRVVPPPLPTAFMIGTGGRDAEAAFYRNLGLNYAAFGRPDEARHAYAIALSFPESAGATHAQIREALNALP